MLAFHQLTYIKADLNDRVSVLKAVQGSTAVYGVTNYWESLDKDLEVQQGKNIADAAKVPFHLSKRLRLPLNNLG